MPQNTSSGKSVKRAKSQPAVAKWTCSTDPLFYGILHFLTTFRAVLFLPPLTSDELQHMVTTRGDISHTALWGELVARLLRREPAAKKVDSAGWEETLASVIDGTAVDETLLEEPEVEDQEEFLGSNRLLDRYSMPSWTFTVPSKTASKAPPAAVETPDWRNQPRARLEILHALCERAAEQNLDVREAMIALENDDDVDIHGEPIGEDSSGALYFHVGREDPFIYRTRMIKQRTKTPVPWEQLCDSLQSIRDLAQSFSKSRKPGERQLRETLLKVVIPPIEAAEALVEKAAARQLEKARAAAREAERAVRVQHLEQAGELRKSCRQCANREVQQESERQAEIVRRAEALQKAERKAEAQAHRQAEAQRRAEAKRIADANRERLARERAEAMRIAEEQAQLEAALRLERAKNARSERYARAEQAAREKELEMQRQELEAHKAVAEATAEAVACSLEATEAVEVISEAPVEKLRELTTQQISREVLEAGALACEKEFSDVLLEDQPIS